VSKACGDCGVAPGELHERGCDLELCRLCGGQLIGCGCEREVAGIDLSDDERELTDAEWAAFDAEIERLGGRLPWTGEYPGKSDCRELGLWCRWVPCRGWVPCVRDVSDAREDLNRLPLVARWDVAAGRWVRP